MADGRLLNSNTKLRSANRHRPTAILIIPGHFILLTMPEHDIAKHTKAVYKAWNSPYMGWKHKLREVLIEIAIIVFAITLSLFLERWREHQREKEIEKQFLTGLKKDLLNDIQQAKQDSARYQSLITHWKYFINTGTGKIKVNTDSMNDYKESLYNSTSFVANSSRFEALKSSAQFGVIEHEELKNSILDLYQQQIESLHGTTQLIEKLKQDRLDYYLQDNLVVANNNTDNLAELLKVPRVQNYLVAGLDLARQIIEEYHSVMQQSREIIQRINDQYELQD